MSIPALNWALGLKLKPTQKLVLLALAHRHHQKTRQCNPSQQRLMADTGLSRSAIKGALQALAALKLVRVCRRQAAGHDLSNQYELLLENTRNDEKVLALADAKDGLQPAPRRGREVMGPGDDLGGPGAGLNREGERDRGPSQKKRLKTILKKTCTCTPNVTASNDAIPDEPFGEYV